MSGGAEVIWDGGPETVSQGHHTLTRGLGAEMKEMHQRST